MHGTLGLLRRLLRKLRTAQRLLLTHGPSVFIEETRERFLLSRSRRGRLATFQLAQVECAETAISVVIPTKDGGRDLEGLLDALEDQKLCHLQLILVDSSTTTPQLRGRSHMDVELVPIRPENFSHSGSRNLGLSRCRHETVLFLVQDARPPDSEWLSRLVQLFLRNKLVALSVAETPRQEADLYARYSVQEHNRSVDNGVKQTVVFDRFPARRRDRIISASIGNVACLYRKEALLRFPFIGRFGEDFLAAIRFLNAGLPVGRTNELTVIHSHNRRPAYWLRRMYASRQLLRRVALSERTYFNTTGPLQNSISTILKSVYEMASGDPVWYEAVIKRGSDRCRWLREGKDRLRTLDAEFAAFLERHDWFGVQGSEPVDSEMVDELRGFHQFMCEEPHAFESDWQSSALCAAASKLGWQLGGLGQRFPWATIDRTAFLEYMENGV